MRTPRGTLKFTGGTQADCRKETTFRSTGKEPILVFLSLKFAISLFRGTICVKFLFRGTQRGFNMIWGYASTKRLRTPALHDSQNPSKNNGCSKFEYYYHSLKVIRFILAQSDHVKQRLLFIDLDLKIYKLIED